MPAITNPKCNKNTTYNTDKTMQHLRLNLKTSVLKPITL